jgi:protein-S-isoprenylcysteine O-methyltransferase Ste14
MFLALLENRWASSIIEVQPGQSVISTGPYGIVRHPMYSGGVLMILATPLALGSLWAFVCAVLLCGIIAARLSTRSGFSRGTCQIKPDCRIREADPP